MKKWMLACSAALLAFYGFGQTKGFAIDPKPSDKKVDILYNGKLLTAYCYPDSVFKPILFPVNTVNGVTVTRGYPLEPRTGERTDHPHHTGVWMNYESVNDLDFWNNSTAIPFEKRAKYGTIRHQQVTGQSASRDQAVLSVTANWQRPDGHILLKEKTTYTFRVKGNRFLIDRTSTLTANDLDVRFKDVKDGFMAIRVARELEMPSTETGVFVDAQGNETKVPVNNNGVTGMYTNDAGVTGDSVWSTKGRWTMLTGKKDGRDITIALFDHPTNTGYPTYWHARGYGLFAANPLGRKVFSNGKEELNLVLKPGQSVQFRYRILVQDGGKPTASEMNKVADDFAK